MPDIKKEKIAYAKEHFAHHKATFNQFDGISTLDWRNKNGSSNYYVRYVFDEDRGCLYISVDLGSAVVQLTERATLQTLSQYIHMVDYFTKKFECSTDKYTYDENAAKSKFCEFLFPEGEEFTDEETEERQDCLKMLMENFSEREGVSYIPYDAGKLLSEISPNYWEWLYDAGRCIDNRVICWLVGLNMAYQQIRKENRNES